MNEKVTNVPPLAGYERLLHAAHRLAEESARKLHELSSRYPEALPPEVVGEVIACCSEGAEEGGPGERSLDLSG